MVNQWSGKVFNRGGTSQFSLALPYVHLCEARDAIKGPLRLSKGDGLQDYAPVTGSQQYQGDSSKKRTIEF